MRLFLTRATSANSKRNQERNSCYSSISCIETPGSLLGYIILFHLHIKNILLTEVWGLTKKSLIVSSTCFLVQKAFKKVIFLLLLRTFPKKHMGNSNLRDKKTNSKGLKLYQYDVKYLLEKWKVRMFNWLLCWVNSQK